MSQTASGQAWDQLVDELKIFPKEESVQMMEAMVSPPLVRSTSTHAEQRELEDKIFSYDAVEEHSEKKQIAPSTPMAQREQKPIFRVSAHRPRTSRTRTRSSSVQRSIDSQTSEKSGFSTPSRRRRRSSSFDMKNYVPGSARGHKKYSYDPCKPGFAFGTSQRRLHAKPEPIPPPGTYMPKVGIGHDNSKKARFCSKSKRFANNYRNGSTPSSMGPGMYTLPSSFGSHSFNVKAGRGGTFSRSKRMAYKADKNVPNASRYYPKPNTYTKRGAALSKAQRFASPEKSEQKNKVPVGAYNVTHIVNHDRQTAYYPISNRKLASKIGK